MTSLKCTAPNDPNRDQDCAVASRRCGLIAGCLLPAMTALTVAHAVVPTASDAPATAVRSLDPDVAPWWELTALPHFGPALAFEVVRYRESVRNGMPDPVVTRVFHQPTDLARVRGIGPVSTRRIERHLRFPKP